jgi:hypothetical protein
MEFHSKIYKMSFKVGRTFLSAVLILWLLSFGAFGQENLIRITTNVLPPYSPYIQDYPGTGNRVQVFVSNLSGKELSVRLIGKLEGDNGVIIRTSPNYRPLQPLQLRATDVNRLVTRSELEGLFDLNQIEVQGMNKNELYRGLPLPEGNYQLCVQAFDNATIRPLSAEFPMGCSGLIPVRIVEPPILISPFENEEVLTKIPQTQMFTWSAPVGIMPNQVEYTLRIVELPAADVNPNVFIDAVVLPQSGLEVKNLRTSSFLYGPSHPPLQVGKKYAWRVQAHSTTVKLNLMNDGKSPVGIFTYGATQVPGAVPLDYIAMTVPNEKSGRRSGRLEVGNNNPLGFAWELDKEFEEKLRKAYNVPAQKTLLDHVPNLRYRVVVKPVRSNDSIILDRQVRIPYLQVEKGNLPANMLPGKTYRVSVELIGVNDLVRKQVMLTDDRFVSKSVQFSLKLNDKGNEADTLTIRGILAYKYPGESGSAHILPNTNVVLSKMEPGNYLLRTAIGKSDAQGRYTIRVLKSALHGLDSNIVFTRCVVDPENPFIQPHGSQGAYQLSNENTFQIARSASDTIEVKGITWLASGYTLAVTAKQAYKDWPGAADVNLSGQKVVIYRKRGLLPQYDKLRLPVEGQIINDMSAGKENLVPINFLTLPENEKQAEKPATKSAVIAVANPKVGTIKNTTLKDISGIPLNVTNSAGVNADNSAVQQEVEDAGYQFIGVAELKATGDAYGASFERLVYAISPLDNYRIYCPGCGQKPNDGVPVWFKRKNDTLTAAMAKVEKFTFNIQTTEAPTMTFKGQLAYRFADPGKDGAQAKPLGNTKVNIEVVYRDEKTGVVHRYHDAMEKEIVDFHKGFSAMLGTGTTQSDGSFSVAIKMTKPMPLGRLAPTLAHGTAEFKKEAVTYIRTIRVVVDNPYYASPVEEFGAKPEEKMAPQTAHNFGTAIAKVRSYSLRVQVKSDTTALQKAGIKNDLFGIRVSVVRQISEYAILEKGIQAAGLKKMPPSDEGLGEHMITTLTGKPYKVIASGKSGEDGMVTLPRMVMANGEKDAYFIATESSVDGLNNYKLVSLKRVLTSEEYKEYHSPIATAAEKAASNAKGKTRINGVNGNCRKTVYFRCKEQGSGTTTDSKVYYYDKPEDAESIKEYYADSDCQRIEGTDCEKIHNYYLGERVQDRDVNQTDPISVLLKSDRGRTVFADQYAHFTSNIVMRYMKPGKPVVNIRVVDKTNPTKGIPNATVTLTYLPKGRLLPSKLDRKTDDEGWISTPFELSEGRNANVKITVPGYCYYDDNTSKLVPSGILIIGNLMLGQNSYYDRVLMQPNTVITGRVVDADLMPDSAPKTVTKATTGTVLNTSKLTSPTVNQAIIKGTVEGVASKGVTNESKKPISTIEAYVQADDGFVFKTRRRRDQGEWSFKIDAPSTAQSLKIFPVNITYFNEERRIQTELPKPVALNENAFTINAGDIGVYQRDHRITFKIFAKGGARNTKGVARNPISGAKVKLFGKDEAGFAFGPSNQTGVVEARFKNVSVENLYVEISAPGYVTQTKSVHNEESRESAAKIIHMEPAATVNGMVVVKNMQGTEVPVEGAEVFVSAGKNATIKYSTVSRKDGSFSLDVDKGLSSCTIEATYNGDNKNNVSGATYIGTSSQQLIPQTNGGSFKLTLTTFDKFSIASIWGFPVTIEKLDPKTMKASGEVDLTDVGLGPFGVVDNKIKVRFADVVFKANPDKPKEGIPASETIVLETSIMDNLVYRPNANLALQNVKYNIKLTALDGKDGKLAITRTPGTTSGKIMAQAQVIDNSFNFSENLLSYKKGQFFLYDHKADGQPGNRPFVTAFDSGKNNIKWTDFGISQNDGKPMELKLLAFQAVSKLEGSRLVGDEIHLNPVMTSEVKDANPSRIEVTIGDLVIKNNTIDAKTGQTPLTFPLAGEWSVEVRNWKLDYEEGGFFATEGVIKTKKVDVPINYFNLRSDFLKLDVDPQDLELAGVAKLQLGGKAYFGYDAKTGTDMKGHWSVVVVPNGDAPAATLAANSLPGLSSPMSFETLSLLDNGQDVVSFGSGSKNFRFFNIVDVRPTTIETGDGFFAFDSGMSIDIPNAPKDVPMRFIYSRPKGGGPVQLKTMVPGEYKFETSGYLNFVAGLDQVGEGKSTALFFADGVVAMRGEAVEPDKLSIKDVLLVHTRDFTHITHNRNLDLHDEKNLILLKNNKSILVDTLNDTKYYAKSGSFKTLSLELGDKTRLSQLYCHQSVVGKNWELMTFSGLPNGFEMLKTVEANRMSFKAYGEIQANDEKIALGGIDTGLGGLSLVYDMKQSRFTGSLQLMDIPIPPTMIFANGMAQFRMDRNGFYVVASGHLQDVPLIIPVDMKAGIMLGYYNSLDLGDASAVLFGNSHRKELPCTFTSGFKGFYVTGELPVPFIGTFSEGFTVPAVGGYRIGVDAYVDGYVYGNYTSGGAFDFGAGVGVGVHAYAFGNAPSLEVGGEVYVNGGVNTNLSVNTSTRTLGMSLNGNLGAGFSARLKFDPPGSALDVDTSVDAGICLKLGATASYTFGEKPSVKPSASCDFNKCTGDCTVSGQ